MEESEWETVQLPYSATSPTGQSDEDENEDGDVVVVKATPLKEPSVFPPSNHEGLLDIPSSEPRNDHIQEPITTMSSPPGQTPPPSSPLSSSYSSSSAPSFQEEVEGEARRQPEENSRLVILSSGILRVVNGIRSRTGFWSIASVATALVVLALAGYGKRWLRLRRRIEQENKDRLMLIIRQKDEKIKQLLLQIDQMNEILSARRRVQVLRVVVDSPLLAVAGPRVNWKPT